jgi:hypothetical protein
VEITFDDDDDDVLGGKTITSLWQQFELIMTQSVYKKANVLYDFHWLSLEWDIFF